MCEGGSLETSKKYGKKKRITTDRDHCCDERRVQGCEERTRCAYMIYLLFVIKESCKHHLASPVQRAGRSWTLATKNTRDDHEMGGGAACVRRILCNAGPTAQCRSTFQRRAGLTLRTYTPSFASARLTTLCPGLRDMHSCNVVETSSMSMASSCFELPCSRRIHPCDCPSERWGLTACQSPSYLM